MRFAPYLRAAAALALVTPLLLPSGIRAFTTQGWMLGLDQRDVRVFDNFLDRSANDNTTPDPNWPGYTGVELAVWKATVEWGSILHGDGSGDPSQPGDLGSGDSNFDPTWQGNAPSAGGMHDNVVSAFDFGPGGIVALTEGNGSGWRIRLNESFLWDDGPGAPAGSALDVQSIVTHEYGHALGLGHSNVMGATMFPAIIGNGLPQRSIEADDIAGMQFIYGTQSALKPFIGAASGGNPVVIDGFAFSPTDNEVWFTQAGINPTGEPIKVTGVSSNGTQIVIDFPLGAGPGDVLVLNSWGRLSNAFPFTTEGCTLPETYCTAGTSALGCIAAIGYAGAPSGSLPSGFSATTTGVEGQVNGLFFFGTNGRQANPWGNGTSMQCVVPPVVRTPLQTSTGTPSACDGTFAYDLNTHWNVTKPQTNPGAGALVQIQTWFRDPFNTSNQTTSLSDALEAMLCP
jgi:hypothetical protein